MKHAQQFLAIAAIAAATWSGMASAAPAATDHALSRAEVQADAVLWNRAGLNAYLEIAAHPGDADYQRRLAQYQRQRSGPEYLAEVQRLGGAVKAAEGQGAVRVPG